MSSETQPSSTMRYHRQMLLPSIGEHGQAMLASSHALIVGCGALGCALGDMLARAGVGTLTIVDRDVVEITNLQRQTLFDEADVSAGTPKAEAARARLASVNSHITIRACVDDFNHRNAERLAADADIILDGLDNFETRYLLNDLAVARGLPYVYGGAVGVSGMSMTILPHPARREAHAGDHGTRWTEASCSPCLRCIFPEAPPPGSTPTCDTVGVLGPVIMAIAAHQAVQALKVLTGNIAAVDRTLLSIDCWSNDIRRFDISGARNPNCPCCGTHGSFAYLRGSYIQNASALCGRDAVQITPHSTTHRSTDTVAIDLAEFAQRLAPHGTFTHNRFLLRGEFAHEHGDSGSPIELTLFANGRAIIKGVRSPEHGRRIYARYIGM